MRTITDVNDGVNEDDGIKRPFLNRKWETCVDLQEVNLLFQTTVERHLGPDHDGMLIAVDPLMRGPVRSATKSAGPREPLHTTRTCESGVGSRHAISSRTASAASRQRWINLSRAVRPATAASSPPESRVRLSWRYPAIHRDSTLELQSVHRVESSPRLQQLVAPSSGSLRVNRDPLLYQRNCPCTRDGISIGSESSSWCWQPGDEEDRVATAHSCFVWRLPRRACRPATMEYASAGNGFTDSVVCRLGLRTHTYDCRANAGSGMSRSSAAKS